MGGIENISPVLQPLSTKTFRKMTGEMRDFCVITEKSTNMEEKKLTYQDVSMGYSLCFNDECSKKACCMHYQARLLMPERRYYGLAVFPTAWQDGNCKCFREKRLVRKAWGFKHLYDNVPQRDKAEARYCVRSSFSGGNGPYYRVHNGENMINLEKQEEIMKILAKFGSIEDIKFDHYVEGWDFG